MKLKPGHEKYHCKEIAFADGHRWLCPNIPMEECEEQEAVLRAIDGYEEACATGNSRARLKAEGELARTILGLVYEDLPEKIGLDRSAFNEMSKHLWSSDSGNGTSPGAR